MLEGDYILRGKGDGICMSYEGGLFQEYCSQHKTTL